MLRRTKHKKTMNGNKILQFCTMKKTVVILSALTHIASRDHKNNKNQGKIQLFPSCFSRIKSITAL